MQIDTERGKRLTGFYRGEVMKHCDNGFCKIFIPGVYSDDLREQPDKLPDAEQASPIFGGATFGDGQYSYPHINSIVWCFFANCDQNYPVYFAATYGGDSSVQTEDGSKPTGTWEYIRKNASDSEDTATTGLDTQLHLIRTSNKNGQSDVLLDENGVITITTFQHDEDEDTTKTSQIEVDGVGNVTIQTDSNITLDTGTISLNASESINLDAPKIKINGNESIILNSKVTKIQKGDQDSNKERSEEFQVYTKRFVGDGSKIMLVPETHSSFIMV